VRAATIATSGPVRDNGEVDLRMTIPEWFGFSLSEALAPAFECHVFAENDTKLGVVGERWKGVAAGLDDVIWIWNNGHRSGVGIVIAGRPYRGLDGRSGEIVWAENLHFRPIRDSVFGIADQPGSPDALKADALVARARSGEQTALDEVNKVVDEIESGITTLVWTLAPQMVVLGPTLGRAADLIAPVLTERLRQYNDVLPVICGSSLGNQAIMYGAIRASLDYVEQTLFHGDIRAVGRLAMGSEG
jgi:predicted NBD/HSP70 family sugar kinase